MKKATRWIGDNRIEIFFVLLLAMGGWSHEVAWNTSIKVSALTRSVEDIKVQLPALVGSDAGQQKAINDLNLEVARIDEAIWPRTQAPVAHKIK